MPTRKPSTTRRKGTTKSPAPASDQAAPVTPPEEAPGAGTVTVTPVFKRNPAAPKHYARMVDVRAGRDAFHLLLYLPPAADPDEIYLDEGRPHLTVPSCAEVILPIDAIQPLIQGLAQQLNDYVISRMREDAAAQGIELAEDLTLEGISEYLPKP